MTKIVTFIKGGVCNFCGKKTVLFLIFLHHILPSDLQALI